MLSEKKNKSKKEKNKQTWQFLEFLFNIFILFILIQLQPDTETCFQAFFQYLYFLHSKYLRKHFIFQTGQGQQLLTTDQRM